MSETTIFGAGRVGTALARTAIRAGHTVTLVGATPMADIRMIADTVAPGSDVKDALDAMSTSDIAVLAIPLHKYRSLDPALFVGRVVIDAMNYWPPVNGTLAEFEHFASSTVIAAHLAGSRLVKTLNHIGYHELDTDGLPPGHPDRRALGVASDDKGAARGVADFIDSLGYDPVLLGSLSASVVIEPETPVFTGRYTAVQMREELTLASTTRGS
ncbi:NADPH-dependent F420 reductase [Streptomyces umbrinus]